MRSVKGRLFKLVCIVALGGALSACRTEEIVAPQAEPGAAVEPAAEAPAAAASEPVVQAQQHPLLMRAYSEIKLEDGVDEVEAETIADTYFDLYISGNGMANGVEDRGEAWEVQTFIDYDMRPYEPIRVDKKSGRMTCAGHPTVTVQ
jgi:hypothetical protein